MLRHRLTSSLLGVAFASASCSVSLDCAEPGALCFAEDDPVRVRVGFFPDAAVFVDLDGDHAPDLVGASSSAGTVTVVWSGSSEPFDAATTWSIDQEVAGIVVADLDDDGHLDLATALPRSGSVAVIRGRGGRSFAGPTRHATGMTPRALVAADLDGVGPAELVTANVGDGTVSVLRELVADAPIVVGPGPYSIAAGDLDNDGHVDLAVALADADAVQVLRGDGNGGLWPAAVHPVGAAPRSMLAADLDGDGNLDLATADSLEASVSVLWGDGAGQVREDERWPTVSLPDSLAVARPPDELPVLMVLSSATDTVDRLDPRSGATLGATLERDAGAVVAQNGQMFAVGEAMTQLRPAIDLILTPLWDAASTSGVWPVDLDGDGLDELLQLEDFNALVVRRGDTIVPVDAEVGYPDDVQAGDLTGDGRIDVLVRAGNSFLLLVQLPDGTLRPGPAHELVDAHDAVLADVDGDATPEVVVLSAADDVNRLLTMRADEGGTLTLTDSRELGLDEMPSTIDVIDGDGDASPDLLLGNWDSFDYLEDMTGAPKRLISGYFGLNGDPALVDLDGDGRLDIVLCSFGVQAIFDILAGQPALTVDLPDTPCTDLEVADVDADGDLDLLVSELDVEHDEPGVRLSAWVRHDDAWDSVGSQWVRSSGYAAPPVLAELDGDGAPEVVLIDSEHTSARDLDIGLALSEGATTRLDARPGLRFGDIDGDGAADLLSFGDSLAVARADGEGGFGPLSHLWIAPILAQPRRFRDVRFLDHPGGGRTIHLLDFDGIAGLFAFDVTLAGLDPVENFAFNLPADARLFVADIDSDGASDILAVGPPALRAWLLRGSADGRFAQPEDVQLDMLELAWQLDVHDLNGDGFLDVVTNSSSFRQLGIYLFPGRGDGTFGPSQRWSAIGPRSIGSDTLVVGDFDRDGSPEVIAEGANHDLLWIHGGERGQARVLLRSIDAVADADLDRDGRPELLVARGSELHVGRSRSDGSFGFTVNDLPTAGVLEIHTTDIDGDGALDVALVDARGATILRRLR